MPNSKRARPEITRLATRRSDSTDISDIYGGYTQAGAAPSPAKQGAVEAKAFSFSSPSSLSHSHIASEALSARVIAGEREGTRACAGRVRWATAFASEASGL